MDYRKFTIRNCQIQIEIPIEKILLENYSDIYGQNITSLFPSVFTNRIFSLVTTEGITVVNERLREKRKNDVLIFQMELLRKYIPC
jgi:hypothetical protein